MLLNTEIIFDNGKRNGVEQIECGVRQCKLLVPQIWHITACSPTLSHLVKVYGYVQVVVFKIDTF
jgi:hypothetical protein